MASVFARKLAKICRKSGNTDPHSRNRQSGMSVLKTSSPNPSVSEHDLYRFPIRSSGTGRTVGILKQTSLHLNRIFSSDMVLDLTSALTDISW
ncbi:uncharacterized protein Dmul_09840 [Desulfococcus multivorans]|nr:uncharacterized protein Dmul_09840 [Desulfococcus multivorans]